MAKFSPLQIANAVAGEMKKIPIKKKPAKPKEEVDAVAVAKKPFGKK